MSLSILGDTKLFGDGAVIKQNYYMSTYYALTNTNVSIEFKNPYNDNVDENTKTITLSSYFVNFGDGSPLSYTTKDFPLTHRYNAEGVYFVSYSAVYINLSNPNDPPLVRSYLTDIPFTIKSNWDLYDPTDVRLNDEIVLQLPYSLDEIEIQPNEWGVEDIFNTSIYRLQGCLDYLIAKTQTINTYTPTLFFGWLGNSTGTKASVIKWNTQSYNSSYVKSPQISKNTGSSFFENVTDSIEVYDKKLLYVLDDKKLKIYANFANPFEIKLTSTSDALSSFLIDPTTLDIDETGSVLYIADQISNTVYKLNFDFDETDSHYVEKNLNLQVFVGGFGGLNNNNNFNNPTQVCYKNENVYVLDYNNYGIKQFNKDLNWIYTYYIEEFVNNRPISIAALKNGLLYVLTENYKVYIFDNRSNVIFESFDAPQTKDDSNLLKIVFDNNENFIYILTEDNVYKYTLAGVYVSTLIIPKDETVKYQNIKSGKNGTLIISTKNCILKIHDILQTFRLGDGMPYKYWSKEQLSVDKNEFATDLTYNRSLARMAQNVISFRNTLNARFIIAKENAQNQVVTYFSYLPINADLELPYLGEGVEVLSLGVAINELHVPSVFNKEFKKIYDALLILTDFLSIKNYAVKNTECLNSFCWSWESTSCYNLKLPVLKTCSVNPISYKELLISQEDDLFYASSTIWGGAKSKCCEKRDIFG